MAKLKTSSESLLQEIEANYDDLSREDLIDILKAVDKIKVLERREAILTCLPVYQATINPKTRYNLLYGGRGGGKSHRLAQIFINKCRGKDYFRGVIMREVSSDIRDSQFQELKDLIEESGLTREFRITENSMSITHVKTKNKIISKGFKKSAGNQTAKVKSIKDPTDIWIEEADEINAEDFVKADTSVRTKRVDHVCIWLTFNPEDEESWIYKRFFAKDHPDTTITLSTYLDNIENLQQKYIDTLEQLKIDDPEWYAVYVLGLWGAKRIVSPFASQYKKSKHNAKVNFNPIYPIHFAIDFNYDPFSVICFQMFTDNHGEHCYVVDEMAIKDGTIRSMADEIRAKFGRYLSLSTFTGDFQGTHKQINMDDNLSLFDQLRIELRLSKSQFKVLPNPRHKTSRSDCNDFLLYFPDFKINPETCSGLCRDMRVVQVDATGSIIKKNRKDNTQLADFLDDFRYMVNTHYQKWLAKHRKTLGIGR